MSDEGEKMCPLCAEEMDLTDQQLKPCRCGYEICVWCWHHIMEMAEKDETEGRCPACRTPYDKEKIVGTASKCERLLAEVSTEKKLKSQKAKTKASDGRKQLSSVRVIQRNLVYIVGLPVNLADEDLLMGKEYFSQYGKVLKVSISRTSAGTIQQFANNSCSVYITYSKEDEAVRCIQSVHGFNLDGRSLRACFGTTKYCHAWLRNMPCTNPDCLYLHEICSTEDSFTKDEIISAYSRVQQITGISNTAQRRSGTVLPPPADDFSPNSATTTGKPVVKSSSNNIASNARVSPPGSSAGRTGVLPPAASWATRASNCQSSAGSAVHSNGPINQKLDNASAPTLRSSMLISVMPTAKQSSDAWGNVKSNEDILPREPKGKLDLPELVKHAPGNPQNSGLETSCKPSGEPARMVSIGRIPSPSRVLDSSKLRDRADEQPNISAAKDRAVADGKMHLNCSDSIISDKLLGNEESEVRRPNGMCMDNIQYSGNQWIQEHCDAEELQNHSASSASSKDLASIDVTSPSNEDSSLSSDIQALCTQNMSSEAEDDFDSKRLLDPMLVARTNPSPNHYLNDIGAPPLHRDAAGIINHSVNPLSVHKRDDNYLLIDDSNQSNGILDNIMDQSSGIGGSCFSSNGRRGSQSGGPDVTELNSSANAIENSIISNILSLDMDAWDESLTSPQNLVKLLGETERQQGSSNMSNSWKAQNSNQSRFSFARQDSGSQMFGVEPSVNYGALKTQSFGPAFVENRDLCLDKLANGFGVPHHSHDPYDGFASTHSMFSTNRLAISRAQISAPPGFSAPSRPPPPGFSSHDRSEQSFDINSGNHFLETKPSLRNHYQATPSANTNIVADIEFNDPAILAVGKGRLPSGLNRSSLDVGPNFSSQTSTFENDSRLPLLMQRSLSAHQSQRYVGVDDNHLHSDGYGFATRHVEPPHTVNLSSFSQLSLQQPRNGVTSNGHYDSWTDVHGGNNIGITELFRNDRLGFNKLYGAYDESKFQMPSSGDLYSRTFGM